MTADFGTESLDDAFRRVRDLDVSLSEQLRSFAENTRQERPEFAAAVDRLIDRLRRAGAGDSAPKPGEPMPGFVLPDENGDRVSLDDLLDEGPVAITFHRGHWCPYCRLNAVGLAEIAPEVERLGAQIVAISPEKGRYAAELKAYARAPFPVLADIDNGYALELNLLFWVGDEKREAMQAGGFDIAPYQGNKTWMLPIPATFIAGRDGVVKARHIDPDYRRRMDLDKLLAALKSAL